MYREADANHTYSQQSQVAQGSEGRSPSVKEPRRCQCAGQRVLRDVFGKEAVVITDNAVIAGIRVSAFVSDAPPISSVA
jgi:hypothetical protein